MAEGVGKILPKILLSTVNCRVNSCPKGLGSLAAARIYLMPVITIYQFIPFFLTKMKINEKKMSYEKLVVRLSSVKRPTVLV